MDSNIIKSIYNFVTFGESHGKAIGFVIDGIKPNIDFPYETLDKLLAERKPGTTKFSSQRNEKDNYQILSGVLNGKTLGTPICVIFPNNDKKSSDYECIKNIFRPNHADYSFFSKFKIYDYRGGGRSSGRETICRVASSAFIKHLLKDITINFSTLQIGELKSKENNSNKNKFYWKDDYKKLEKYLLEIQNNGDSVGGIIKVTINNVPKGLGDPVFEKIDANIAKAIISIGAIKGISFGLGFKFGTLLGSQVNDQWDNKFLTNNSGGIVGGITNAEPIIFTFVVKPTPSIKKEQKTFDINNNLTKINIKGRHDICIIPRIIPVVKAMINLTLTDAIAYQNLIENKSLNLENYRESIEKIDEDLLILLKKRNKISKLIGNYKKDNKIEITDKKRELTYLENLKEKAQLLDLDSQIIKNIWELIFKISKKEQSLD